MRDYTPSPVRTEGILLSHDLQELATLLAVDSHERWAKLQMQNGWSWGIRRDPFLNRDPDLTPFDKLPMLTKEHVIQAATQNLKALLAYGYTISPPQKAA